MIERIRREMAVFAFSAQFPIILTYESHHTKGEPLRTSYLGCCTNIHTYIKAGLKKRQHLYLFIISGH